MGGYPPQIVFDKNAFMHLDIIASLFAMRHLVYYTIGCKPEYIEMLNISIQSLRTLYSGDIAVLCDESLLAMCRMRIPDIIYFSVPNSKTGQEASMNKLKIFDFISEEYDSVLYIDTDILIYGSLDPILHQVIDKNLLYVYTESTDHNDHKKIYWSLESYTDEELSEFKNKSIYPFNAGTFAFVPSPEMKSHFTEIRHMIETHTGSFFYEQSFLNVYFNKLNLTNRTVFTKNTINLKATTEYNSAATIVHFADWGMMFETKYEKMKQYSIRYPVRIFDTRDKMLEIVSTGGTYAEVGVFEGIFSNRIWSILQPKNLILIDLFEGVSWSGNADGNNVTHVNLNDVYNRLIEQSKILPLSIHKGDSSSILSTFPDNMFDMIYLDGDHSYQGCKKDLDVCFHKCKPYGWIMGHDYETNLEKTKNIWPSGVKEAVSEFCIQKKQRITAKAMDGCVSFAIQLIK